MLLRLQKQQKQHQQRNTLIGITLLIISALVGNTAAAIDETINEHEGKTVVLPCPVNKDKCGELHSINWFKGDDRIVAMLLGDSNVTSVASEFEDRVTVDQNPYRLILKDLQISDEDIYLCDTTFFIPVETCDNFNGYRVELNVLVPPTEVVILDEKGDRIENGSVVGPIQERQMLKASCVVRNTRPQPQVGWWRGNKRLTTHSPSYDEKEGLYTATLELSLELSREDLGEDIECRVESAALKEIVTEKFHVDLQVRPTSIILNGVEHHTVQGSKVVLTCDVHGARPPVNLTWYNASSVISPEENDLTEIRTKAFEKEDGTYHTQSELIFNATRFENDMLFRCDAENIVLQINREKPLISTLLLEVLYPPVVKVSPPEITVNTSDTVLLNCEYVANPASLTHVVWYRNGDLVNVNDTDSYEGGNSENVALVIRSTDKEDIGNYTCQLSNVIGKGVSEQQIDLDVQFVPIVEVLMIPEGPVKESDESNVTLYCNILDANPAVLTKVRWYANQTLLKELPDCEETKEDLCHIDPSKLLLESIGRGFFYNYSCEGSNAAGWGPRSDDKELMVHYEPGPATLTHFPLIAVKKKSVTFSCSVDDPGYPESNRFRWLRGGRGPLQDVVTKDWTVEPVGLDSRTNYSCYAFNEGGKGVMATANLEVHAPPFFIKNLPPYTGMLHSARYANLTCRIECVPRCEISWLKDGVAIEKNDTRYFVKEKYMDASPATGDFESMLSVLHFNMSNWPNQKFDIEADNANYTCVSTGNTVGAGIKSGTYFSIEYAPDNTTVSEDVVYVHEDTIPGRVVCKARANPEPSYEWRFNNKTVIRGNNLIINTPMLRNDSGTFTCIAFNKHGSKNIETFIDVQFKPRCEIERQEIDDHDTLICTAYGNPVKADFSWSIKGENETVQWLGSGENEMEDNKSFYILEQGYEIARTYRCVANNTAGMGAFCEIEVAEQLVWWQRWDKTTLIILIVSILALLLAVIIICCIIICICRRRRRQDKYHTDVSVSATHSVLSYQSSIPQVGGVAMPTQTTTTTENAPQTNNAPPMPTLILPSLAAQLPEKKKIIITPRKLVTSTSTTTASSTATMSTTTPTLTVKHAPQIPKSPPRWPLRPGVMVHVSSDTKENLAVNRMTLKPNTNINSNTNNNSLTAQLSSRMAATNVNDSSLSCSTLNASSSTMLNNTTSTAQTSLLNISTQTTTGVVKETSTLGRINCRNRQASGGTGGGTSGAHRSSDFHSNACQTLPHRSSAAKTQLKFTTAKVNPNNQILSVDSGSIIQMTDIENGNREETERLTADGAQSQISVAHRNNASSSLVTAELILESNATDLIAQPAISDNILTTIADGNRESVLEEENPRAANSKTAAGSVGSLERVENFFASIFKRSKRADDSTRDSQRSHVGLLGGVFSGAHAFWKRSESSAEKSPQFSAKHRLKGIRCSGSVTYKKTPILAQRNAAAANTNNNNNTELPLNANNSQTPTTTDTTEAIAATVASSSHPQSHHLPTTGSNLPRSHVSVTFQTPSLARNSAIAATATTPATAPVALAALNHSIISHITSSPSKQQRGILKSPTPPPRPPPPFRAAPPPIKKRTVVVTPTKKHVERVQIHDKSSSLGDPLTEPGEYENLPFHGLQTAPNKFSTTPTNFNNNTNVVRVAPRPKRLNGNISQTHVQQQQQQQQLYDQQQQLQYHQHPQQHQQQQQLQQQYNTIQYGRSNTATTCNQQPITAATAQTLNSHNKSLHNMHEGIAIGGGGGACIGNGALLTNPHQITYNLNNCFPKSYTEYYHQQQQQKYTNSAAANSASNAQLLNALEQHDYPAYAVVERNTVAVTGNSVPVSASIPMPNTNPFLAVSNFKKFDTEVGAGGAGSNGIYPSPIATATATTVNGGMDGISVTGSMHRNKRKPLMDKSDDKKFYSLKFTGGKNKAAHHANKQSALQSLNASMGGGGGGGGGVLMSGSGSMSTANKCKRHHSFAGGSIGDIDSQGPSVQRVNGSLISGLPPMQQQMATKNAMRFYDPPVYENLSDSVQIHECEVEAYPPQPGSSNASSSYHSNQQQHGATGTATILLHTQPHTQQHAGQTGQKTKKHHHRQHQQKDDFNLIEPERLSIYRSDSGISNSSYECVTPVPANGGPARASNAAAIAAAGGTPPPKTPKSLKSTKGNSKQHHLANATMSANFASSHSKKATQVPTAVAAAAAITTPVYMNVDGQPAQVSVHHLDRSCSPVSSTLVNSSYESASSSQNDGTGPCSTDPTSLSSCNSLYSSGTGTIIGSGIVRTSAASSRCGHYQKPAEITTPEDFEQYQLGHHKHSVSSLSVASSTVSASGGGAPRKCKKQQQQQPILVNEPTTIAATTNPFLAIKRATATATTSTTCNKKLRRQTISDPYAHIMHINNNNSNVTSSNSEPHNNSAKYAYNAFKTTAAAATATHTAAKSQQQINLQSQHNDANGDEYSQHSCYHNYQQQMLMPNEMLLLQQATNANNCSTASRLDEKLRLPEMPENKTGTTISSVIDESIRNDLEQQRRQQYEEEFARNAAAGYLVQQQQQQQRRPVKLPLRKYHSFHFQPSQTVAGIQSCKLQQLRMQMQQQEHMESQSQQLQHDQQQQLQLQQQQQFLATTLPPLPAPEKPPKRYAHEGPLVFRPLTLNENQSFKPISPTTETTVTIATVIASDNSAKSATPPHQRHRKLNISSYEKPNEDLHSRPTCVGVAVVSAISDDVGSAAVADDEEEKSEMSEELSEEIKQITTNLCNTTSAHGTLNPAASLEALEEALAKSNSNFFYATKAGSRQNLHTQLSLNDREMISTPHLSDAQLQTNEPAFSNAVSNVKAYDTLANYEDDEEDLGYSFCEDDDGNNDYDCQRNDARTAAARFETGADVSPNATVILTTERNGNGQVKYLMTQSYREVHI